MQKYISEIVERQVAGWNAAGAAARERSLRRPPALPVVTVARELGSGGAETAKRVAENLGCCLVGYSIVDSVAAALGFSKEVLNFMDERLKSEFMSWFDSSFCGEMDQRDYHQYMKAMIRSLTELGSVVFLGRGAAFVKTRRRKINVRIVAPKEERVRRVKARLHLNEREALAEIDKSDKMRTKFIRAAYHREWSDPAEYDFVINTAKIDIPHAAAMIESVWRRMAADERNDSLRPTAVYISN